MNRYSIKTMIFITSMFLVILPGITKSYAQTDSSLNPASDEDDQQAREAKTQETLNQIHDLEQKMEDNSKKLDALEKAVANVNTTNQEVPVQAAPEQAVPAQVVPEQEAAPVQSAPVQETAPIHTAPVQTAPMKEQTPLQMENAQMYNDPTVLYHKVHTFELAQEDFYSSFKEPGSYNKNGGFFGLYGAYDFRPLNTENWLINVYHVDIHGDYGLDSYNYGGDKIRNVNNYTVEPRVWFGKDIDFNPNISLTPYAGFGYRWYFDQLKNKTDVEDDGGFNIQTQYFYIPVGGQLSIRPTEGWRIVLDSEYDFLAFGRVTDYLSNNGFGNYGLSNVTNSVRQGYGIQDSIKIIKEGDAYNYYFEPFIRYWNINDSNTISVYGFPIQEYKNHTAEIGARLGVEF